MEWLVLVVAGVAGGAVNAIAGGGSLITFPTLVLLGLPPVAANVTNSVAVFPGFPPAVWASRADLVGQRRVPGLLVTLVAGTLVGCALLLLVPAGIFAQTAPALVLLATATIAAGERLRRLRTAEPHPAAAHAAVAGISVYGGYFGAAAGLLLIAALSLTTTEPLHRVNAAKVLFQGAIAAVTVAVFAVLGPVDWVAVAVLAPATMLGGYLGARVGRALPIGALRAAIVVFGTAAGLALLLLPG